MKKYSVAFLSAVAGSVLTIALVLALGIGQSKVIKVDHLHEVPGTNTLYAMDQDGEIVPLDFTEISKKLMDAVVHISPMQTIQQRPGNRTLPDPFWEFFGEEFFRQYQEQQRDQQQRQPQQRQQPQRRGTGSGVIINSDGYIVTNNHVVENADEILVTLHDNRAYKASVIGTDPTTDLALIKINETNLVSIPMVDSDDIEVGEWVLAMGNPFNLNSTVTAGIVSAKSRSIQILDNEFAIEAFIQTDAAINPGNSGGALVNMQGGLVGINTAIASPTGAYSGYGFAVPSNLVNKVIGDLLEFGTVQRGYLGVQIFSVNAQLTRDEDLKVNSGAYIDSVIVGSAAEKAGLQKGDVVVEIEGRRINQSSQLQEMVARQRPGDEIEMVINRNGKEIQRTAVLQNIEGATEISETSRGTMNSEIGAELRSIEKDLAKELNIDGGVQVTRLYPGLLRSETDMQEGFIITKINGKNVRTPEDVGKLLENTKGGVMLEGIYEAEPDRIRYFAFGIQ
ncbi:MAG TPA: Do family serine endopeptidase [Mariniphaga sp.]|nr:Do family serine endopeptidase [Mariniphaga sp.]